MPSTSFHPDPAIATQRQTLRRAALSARETLSPTVYARLNTALSHHVAQLLEQLRPQRIAYCWPYRHEPDLRAVLTEWQASHPDACIALPLVIEAAAPLQFRRWQPEDTLVLDRHGIPSPLPEAPQVHPDLILIPLNAFDAAGYRIGYGGGYFDRTLATLNPRPLSVGVGFELGRVADTHPQAHDQPMDWLVTEAGLHPCPASAGHSSQAHARNIL